MAFLSSHWDVEHMRPRDLLAAHIGRTIAQLKQCYLQKDIPDNQCRKSRWKCRPFSVSRKKDHARGMRVGYCQSSHYSARSQQTPPVGRNENASTPYMSASAIHTCYDFCLITTHIRLMATQSTQLFKSVLDFGGQYLPIFEELDL